MFWSDIVLLASVVISIGREPLMIRIAYKRFQPSRKALSLYSCCSCLLGYMIKNCFIFSNGGRDIWRINYVKLPCIYRKTRNSDLHKSVYLWSEFKPKRWNSTIQIMQMSFRPGELGTYAIKALSFSGP